MATSLALSACAALLLAQDPEPRTAAWLTPPQQTVEYGAVRWERDFDAAAERSRREGKPLLVLFQEVPG